MDLNKFFKDKKFINAWSAVSTRPSFDFPKQMQGDVTLIYNDRTSGKGRRVQHIRAKDYFYFYVENKDYALKYLKEKHPNIRIQVGVKYIRVFHPNLEYKDVELKAFVDKLEGENIKTYEADISPMKRMCLDYDAKVEDWGKIRVLYLDIETDDSNEGIEIGRDRILSIAGVDREGKEYYLTNADEKVLLVEFAKFIKNWDMIVGWNSKDFDLPYLKKRMWKHRLQTNYLSNILHEDMMRRVQYFYAKDPEARQNISSYSLQSISEYFLGEGKIPHEEKIIELFNDNPKKLKEYNIQDCKLLKKLEDKLGLIEVTYQLFQTCQCWAQNWSTVKTIDNFILSDANKKGVHYRSNLSQMEKEYTTNEERLEYLGAYVIDPDPGYYEKVYDLDFASLYPNIIRTFNISPDSLIEEHDAKLNPAIETIQTPEIEIGEKKHGGLYFDKNNVGIIPNKIKVLLEDRKKIRIKMKGLNKRTNEYKNLNVKQLVIKELANSIYGVLGNKYFREFSIELAESITATGQYFIKWLVKYFEEQGDRVIYGDTDSVFVVLGDKNKDINEVLSKANDDLNSHITETFKINTSTIELELDAVFDQFLIEAKKKYVAKTNGEYKYIGLECIKRDTIPLAVKYQKNLIEKIFNGADSKTLHRWVKSKYKEISEKELTIEELTIRKKLSKSIDLYTGKDSTRKYTAPIHVRIAKRLSGEKGREDKTTLYAPGSIIQYIITDGAGGKINEALHISEYKGKWDRTYYWNNIIYSLLERLLETTFPEEDWNQYRIKKERKKPVKKVTKNVKKISKK